MLGVGLECQVSRQNTGNIGREWEEPLSCCFASVFNDEKTGLQIRNGRTNIIKTELKPQIREVKESIQSILMIPTLLAPVSYTPHPQKEIADVISETQLVILK